MTSAQDLTQQLGPLELIRVLRGRGTQLVDQLAAETGVTVVSNLYSGALGDPPVTSYEAVIRWDTDQFVKALT